MQYVSMKRNATKQTKIRRLAASYGRMFKPYNQILAMNPALAPEALTQN